MATLSINADKHRLVANGVVGTVLHALRTGLGFKIVRLFPALGAACSFPISISASTIYGQDVALNLVLTQNELPCALLAIFVRQRHWQC